MLEHEIAPTNLSPNAWRAIAIGSACAASVLGAAAQLGTTGQLTVVGILVSVLIGLAFVPRAAEVTLPALPHDLDSILLLAKDEALAERHRRATRLLVKISQQCDSIYRAVALDQIDAILGRMTSLAAGSIVFEGTETWRLVYEQLLRSAGLYLYRSVAWVKTADYWQDEPGRKSLAVNFELCGQEQLTIERIAILADELWPVGSDWPVEPIRSWLTEQHRRGICLKIVRASALDSEPELRADIGIYGARALGTQELDETCRTHRFVLTFDFAQVAEAEARWQRLSVYARLFSVHLDRNSTFI